MGQSNYIGCRPNASHTLLAISGLSFLGLGAPPPTPEWGAMLNEASKSVVALSILRLLPENAVVSGAIIYKGHDLLTCPSKQLLTYRGREIAMIFEQPASCLNPVMSIGEQLAEVYRAHGCSKREARAKAHTKLAEVGISPKRYSAYPHELSGGMQQRLEYACSKL
jgi:ABC-type glutathione transport system ATPase component